MSKIIHKNGFLKLKVVRQLVKTVAIPKTDPVEYKEVIAKEIYTNRWCRKDSLTSPEEYITTRNKIAKSRCTVFDRDCGTLLIVNHSLFDLEQAFIEENKDYYKIGFSCR